MAVIDIPSSYAPIGNLANLKNRSTYRVKSVADNAKNLLTYGVPLVLAGGLETIAQSTGMINDNATLASQVRSVLGNTAGDLYAKDHAGFKATGDIAASMIPIMIAPELVAADGLLDTAINAIPQGEKLAKFIITSGISQSDRVGAIADAAKIFKTEGLSSLSQSAELGKAIQAQKLSALFDSVKNSVAIDTMMYGMQNQSKLLYPAQDNPINNLILYAGFDTAFALAAYKFTGAAIMRNLSDTNGFAKEAEHARNRVGLLQSKTISTPTDRGVTMAVGAVKMREAQKLLENPNLSKDGMAAMQAQLAAGDEIVKKQIKLAGKDVLFKEPLLDQTHTFSSQDGELKTVLASVKEEPSSAVGILSIAKVTPDSWQVIPKTIDKNLAEINKSINGLAKTISTTEDAAVVNEFGVKTYPKLSIKNLIAHKRNQVNLDRLHEQKAKYENAIPTVREIDGSVTPLQSRRSGYMDTPEDVPIEKTANGHQLQSTFATKIGMGMAITPEGRLLLSAAKATADLTNLTAKVKAFNLDSEVVNGLHVARSLSPTDIQQEIDSAVSHNLIDMTFTYSRTGRIGKDLYVSMLDEFVTALSEWKGASKHSKIREWARTDPQKLLDLQNEFKKVGLHKRLYELANDNGMVPLYRGEPLRSDITNVHSDIVSMSPNAAYVNSQWGEASGRAELNTVRVNAHVEDIIGIVDRGKRSENYTHAGVLKLGESHTLSHEFEIIVKGNKSRITEAAKRTELLKNKKSFDEALQPIAMQKLNDFQSMTWEQRSVANVLANQFIKDYSPEASITSQGTLVGSLTLDKTSTSLELDIASELMQKYPDAYVAHWLPDELLTKNELLSTLQFQSAAKKATSRWKISNAHVAGDYGLVKLSESQRLSTYDMMRMDNLPNDTAVGKHPFVQYIDSLNPGVGKDLPELRDFVSNLKELQTQVGQYVTQGHLFEQRQLAPEFGLTGISIRADLPTDRRPALVWQKNVTQLRVGPEDLNPIIQAKREARFVSLTHAGENGAGYVNAAFSSMTLDPVLFNEATNVQSLIEGTQAGSGFATQAAFNLRNQPTLQALDLIGEVGGRAGVKYIAKAVFNDRHLKVFSQISSSEHKGSLTALEINMNELRNGWDVLPTPISHADEKFSLELNPETERNATLWKTLTGRSFAADLKTFEKLSLPVRATMNLATEVFPRPVILDAMALEAQTVITQISHDYLRNRNFLAGLQGLPPVVEKPWHIPYTNIVGKQTAYIVEHTGSVHSVIHGSTQDEANRLARKEVELLREKGQKVALQAEEFVRQHIKNAGFEFNPSVNFGRAGKQTGTASGASGTDTILLGTLKDTLSQLQRNFLDLQQHTAAVIFEPELDFVRSMAATVGRVADSQKYTEASTIFQMAERAILQTASLNRDMAFGKAVYGIEDGADMYLAKLWDTYNGFFPKHLNGSAADFAKLNKTLGSDYNPIATLDEFLMKTEKRAKPMTLRSVGGNFASLTTNLVVRIVKPGMALTNIFGVVAVLPSIVKELERGTEESVKQHLQRIGASSSPIANGMAMPHTGRMLITAVHGMFDGETRYAMKEASRKYGLMSQQAAERMDIMTAPLKGRVRHRVGQVIDAISYLTDRSEVLSRAMTFSALFNVAVKSLKMPRDAAILFAHRYANAAVGDYRQVNKPQIFQSATTAPLGMFTTWLWNILQRSYASLEGGRLSAVAIQVATQAFLFGGEGLPGYNPIINVLTASYDGKTNLIDTLDAAYGAEFTNFVTSGVLANADKMFGFGLHEGLALQTRGSVEIPSIFQGIAHGSLADAVPAYQVTSTLTEGLSSVITELMQNGTITKAQALEAVSVYGVNGAIRALAEETLGYSTNRAAELVTKDVRQMPEVIARIVSVNTLTEERKRKELARNHLQLEIQADHMKTLARSIRTASRNHGLTTEFLHDTFTRYMRAGGSASSLRRWLKAQIIAGQFSKTDRLLVEKLGSEKDLEGIRRLLRLENSN